MNQDGGFSGQRGKQGRPSRGAGEGKHRRDSAACNRDRAGIPGASSRGLAEGTPCPGWSVPIGGGLTRVVGDTEGSGGFRLPTTTRTHPRVHVWHRASAGESGPQVLILDWPDTSGELCCLASVSPGSSLAACQCPRRSGFLSSSGKGPWPVAGVSSRSVSAEAPVHTAGGQQHLPLAVSAVQTQAGACSRARPLL